MYAFLQTREFKNNEKNSQECIIKTDFKQTIENISEWRSGIFIFFRWFLGYLIHFYKRRVDISPECKFHKGRESIFLQMKI